MNGAGNDFVLIDQKQNEWFDISPDKIIRLCDRRKGIGADGVLIIKESEKYDFELKYYNSDGSTGSLCGNGARCSIKYVMEKYYPNKIELKFICARKVYSGFKKDKGEITFELLEPKSLTIFDEIEINKTKFPVHFVDTGSPHVVIFWDDIFRFYSEQFFDFPINKLGKEIRYHTKYAPNGTNVNIVIQNNEEFFIRTYERGVENETFACGTGSVAAAIIISTVKKIKPPIVLNTFGNDKLTVDFNKINSKFSKITLTGPAKINYIGSCNF